MATASSFGIMAASSRYGKWVDQGLSAKAVSPMHVKVVSRRPLRHAFFASSDRPLRAQVRVLAIPQAGMGAWAFHGWQEKLPKSVEMLPVELPGRNSRMLEEKGASMFELVGDLVTALSPHLENKPFVVLGHSLGAWMAFEVCNELERRHGPKPLCLFVSGCRAPQLHEPMANDADRVAPCIAGLPAGSGPGSFWAHFERRYGKNPDLASDSIKEYVEPLLRSDFKILETYEPTREASNKFAFPIHGCGARGDNRFTPDQLTAWGAFTDAFDETWFDTAATMPKWSTPHRYLVDSPDAFVAFLGPKCEALFKNKPKPPPIRPGSYAVANKKGALVREGVALDTPQVGDLLPVGTHVTVDEAVAVPNGKPRARISAPVAGWLSCHVIAQLLG